MELPIAGAVDAAPVVLPSAPPALPDTATHMQQHPASSADVASLRNSDARDDMSVLTSSESAPSEASSSPASSSKKHPSSSQVATSCEKSEPAKRKPRSQWYALQKEEKALLLKEAKYLEAQLDFIASQPWNAAALELGRLEQENRLLREAMKNQQFELAGAQSALASHTIKQPSPFEHHIRLGRDPAERHAALLKIKDETLRDAEGYLRERSRFLDVTQKYWSMEKSTSPNGDFVIRTFEMTQLPGVTSVRLVFDALRFFFFNLDISLTESSGELIVREGKDELVEQNVCQQRLLRSANCGAQIESNCAMTASYSPIDSENGFGREYAVVTMNFIDDDELFPYKPQERIRQDISAAITVRTFPRKVSTVSEGGGGDEFEIVMCRTYVTRVHHSDELLVPAEVFDAAVVDADMCSREILRTVYDVVHAMGQIK